MKRKFLLFRLFALVAALSCTFGANAYDFKSGVLYYNITSSTNKTVEVTYGMYNPSSGVYNQGSYSGIEDVIIPSSVPYNGTSYQVTAIGDCAFHSSFIKSVTIPSTVTTIGDASFHDCNRMTSITIPNSVTSIGEGAFQYVSFTSLIIPDSVKTIGMYAFHGCMYLESLTIGSSVTSIGDYAFVECPALTSLTCLAKTPPVFLYSYDPYIYPFSEDTYNRATLYVPRGCSGDYRSADWWGNFTHIQELPYSFKYNDLYYRINGNNTVITGSNTVEVYGVVDGFSGSLSIPSSVPFGGKTYQVTAIGDEAFMGCRGLTSVTIPTSVVSIGQYAFSHCSGLTSIALGNSVSSIGRGLFFGCSNLTTVDLSEVNTSNVTDMGNMFCGCELLTTLDLRSFNTARVTYMDGMFKNCYNLTTILVGDGWNTSAVTESTDMFYLCNNIVGSSGTTYDSRHVDKAYAHIDGGTANPGYLSAPLEAYAVYTSSNTTLTFYYDALRSTRTGTTYDAGNTGTYPAWYLDGTSGSVTKVVFDPSFGNARPTSTAAWFMAMTNMTYITGEKYLNTSDVTDMTYMYALTNFFGIDLSHFDTSKVKSMYAMFGNCNNLNELELGSFNTWQVTNMGSMFRNCPNLETIYVGSDWVTYNVTYSSDMFRDCPNLVGGNGTTYDANHVNKAYAHIDGGPSDPGYLTTTGLEAYACYSSSNTKLTFYYDNLRSSRSGTTYDLNTSGWPGWYTDRTYENVTKVVFDPSFAGARPTSTVGWFMWMSNLTSITGLSYLNTVKVTNMHDMFAYCSGLTSLDVSSFNTSNVTNMQSMFANCTKLKTIYVGEDWSTAAVTSSQGMFNIDIRLMGSHGTIYDENHTDKAYAHIDGGTSNPGYFTAAGTEAYACYTPDNTTLTFYHDNLRSSRSGITYDLKHTEYIAPDWQNEAIKANVTKVVFDPSFAGVRPTTTHHWFYEMSNLQNIMGLNYLNTSEVIDMRSMFHGCSSLTSLDVGSFNTSNVTNMQSMFANCYQLESLNLSNFNTVNVTDMNAMFSQCNSLSSLDLSHFNTSKVADMKFMFIDCYRLESLDLGSFNTSQVTDMSWMFYDCHHLRTIYVGNGWSTAAVTESVDMFNDCYDLVGGKGTTFDANHIDKTYAHLDGGTNNPGYFTAAGTEAYAYYSADNTTLYFCYDPYRNSHVGTTYSLNEGSNKPDWVVDGTNANVTKVVFDYSFAAARPTTTFSWFYNMMNLYTISGVNYLNTSEVTNMAYMFYYCTKMTNLDLSHFNTSQVTDMSSMFYNCYRLVSLDLSTFNTANVTSMRYMFSSCASLKSLDLSSFNTSNVTNMRYMFDGCSEMTSLNLGSFNTSKVTTMQSMFSNCNKLQTIYAGNDWSTAAVTSSSSMFNVCSSLVGGKGTTYDANHIDKAYAHLDGGPSNPGYLTLAGTEAYACFTPADSTVTFYYDNLRNSRPGTTYKMNTNSSIPGWTHYGNYVNVAKMVFDPSFAAARPTSTYRWFYNMTNLKSITGLNYLNTSEVTNMDDMFTNCKLLTSLDLSSFNTSKVVYMGWMFSGCTNLRTIYVGDGWNTAAVTSSSDMFWNCTSLVGGKGTTFDANHIDKAYAHIDGGPSDPGYLTDINAPAEPEAYACYTSSNTTLTFYYDTERYFRTGTTYDMNEGMEDPGWDTDGSYTSVTQVVFDPSFADARPTSTCSWFWGMTNLLSITGMDCLNTEDVTTMWGMFRNCSSVTTLDVSSFNTSRVTNMLGMFADCSNLTTIYGGDGWNTASVGTSGSMFLNCTRLVGGQGTVYDANHVDKRYAHIDGGTSNPGYLTDKNAILLGDVNGDGNVGVADVTALVDYVLTGNSTGINLEVSDVDGDGVIGIGDVTAIIDIILGD